MKVIREGNHIVAFRHWFRWHYTLALDERCFMPMFKQEKPDAKR